mgnify:CR=1 FL=1
MGIHTKAQITEQLKAAGERMVRVRKAGQLIKDAINQTEPDVLLGSRGDIVPGSVVQGDNKRRD